MDTSRSRVWVLYLNPMMLWAITKSTFSPENFATLPTVKQSSLKNSESRFIKLDGSTFYRVKLLSQFGKLNRGLLQNSSRVFCAHSTNYFEASCSLISATILNSVYCSLHPCVVVLIIYELSLNEFLLVKLKIFIFYSTK